MANSKVQWLMQRVNDKFWVNRYFTINKSNDNMKYDFAEIWWTVLYKIVAENYLANKICARGCKKKSLGRGLEVVGLVW